MAKEKNLTTVTSVAAADFARLVTSAGASVKATAANLAKYIIETYNGSTVAGSAQSVKSALDSLNSKYGIVADCNALPLTGLFLCRDTTLNTPVAKYGLLISWAPAQNQALQCFIDTSSATVYTRQTNMSVWTQWKSK